MRYPHHTPNDSLRNLQVRKIKEIKNVCGKSVAAPLPLQKTKQNVSTAICYCLEIGKWFFLFIFELDRKKCTLSPIFRRGSGKGRKKKEWDAFKVWHFSVLRLISLLKCVYLLSHPPFSTLSVLTSLSFLWVYASVSCLCSPGAQKWQIPPLWAQLQRFQQWGCSVSHRQKDPIIHHRPSIWHIIHVSQLNLISAIKLLLHHWCSSTISAYAAVEIEFIIYIKYIKQLIPVW